MKRILVFLMLIGISFADNIPMSLVGTSNGTIYNINIGDCYVLSYDGIFTNITFCPKTIDASVSLNPGQNYTNTLANITVVALVPPPNLSTSECALPNISSNLTPGQSYINGTIRIQCTIGNTSTCTKLNQNITLDYGQNFSNADIGVNITTRAFPSLNIERNLSYGETLNSYNSYDQRFNFTFRCQDIGNYCNQNVDRTLLSQEIFFNPICNITLRSPNLFIGVSKDLAFGEVYDDVSRGIHFSAPATPVIPPVDHGTFVLTEDNPTFVSNLTTDLKVSCDYNGTSVKRYLMDSNNSDCQTIVSIPGTGISWCPGKISTACSADEKLNGDLEGCVNRLVNASTSNYDSCQGSLIKTQQDYKSCSDNTTNQKMFLNSLGGLLIGAVVGTAFIAIAYFQIKKKRYNEDMPKGGA